MYGPDATDPLSVTYVLGYPDLAAQSPWIKTKTWKRFLATIAPLVEGPVHREVQVLVETSGAGLVASDA